MVHTANIIIRVTDGEKRKIKNLAKFENMDASSYIRKLVIEKITESALKEYKKHLESVKSIEEESSNT